MRKSLSAALIVLLLTSLAVPAQAEEPPASSEGLLLINELANGGSRSDSDTFFELRNFDDHAVDLTGWQVFRCSAQGLRSNVGRPEGDFTGVVLQPGQILTVSKVGMPGDLHTTSPFDTGGFGLYLEKPDNTLADAIGVYPNEPWPTTSECSVGANLPNSLSFALDESWQRTPTGWVKAPATPGLPNALTTPARAMTSLIINEFAASGPAGTGDEFVELRNLGSSSVDIGGYSLYRCTATGRMRPSTHELTVADGTTVAPGGYFVIGGPGFTGTADASYGTELADVTSGVYLQSRAGLLVDRISVSAYTDSACQDGDDKLPAVLDYVAAESYQQGSKGWVVASRTPGSLNETDDTSVFAQPFRYTGGVAISEFAADPAEFTNNFVELANYGSSTVDISGWTIRRCEVTGIRSRELQLTIADGTRLGPDDTFVAAKTGEADAYYQSSFNFLGTGVWVADANGNRVDSLGVYAANEMDSSNVTQSPCTKGAALTTYQPDRTVGETFQRTRFTGTDCDDFVVAPATRGTIDEHVWVDPTLRVSGSVEEFASPVVEPVETVPGDATGAVVLEAWAGVTESALETLVGPNESPATGTIADDGYAYPYVRYVLDASALSARSRVFWSGSTTGRNELQFSVWSPTTSSWRLMDAGSGSDIQLSGSLLVGEIAVNRVTVLVQNGPRTEPTMTLDADGALQNPNDYDLAISHITDTQYLTESYPEVYAELVSWIADNAETRKIAFATHTGDLVQNWVDPDQSQDRARTEFARASQVQAILDDAGVPNSVLPGNHDIKRGTDDSLFNEYFAPSRYPDSVPIAPDDNTSNYTLIEQGGARFLMLSLGYAYGEREIAWASDVVSSHPDYNVIISTHEHVTPLTLIEPAHRSANSRWVSHGQDLWDRVIAPNRNVLVVLSGHFHGLGQIRTENAGGIDGHDVVELLADYQEFRTHDGERATGFQRLLQLDLDSSTIAVDTFSVALDASASFDYDYPQFVPDTGLSSSPSNMRPWNIVALGTQDRYTAADDEFTATVQFQFSKLVATQSLVTAPPLPVPELQPVPNSSASAYTELLRVNA